jgi:hypothetical protein
VESIGKVFINEDESTDEKYKGYLHVEKMLGSVDQLANPWLVSQIDEWTEAHRLRGIAYQLPHKMWLLLLIS